MLVKKAFKYKVSSEEYTYKDATTKKEQFMYLFINTQRVMDYVKVF